MKDNTSQNSIAELPPTCQTLVIMENQSLSTDEVSNRLIEVFSKHDI